VEGAVDFSSYPTKISVVYKTLSGAGGTAALLVEVVAE
jgi:hypothetical protein